MADQSPDTSIPPLDDPALIVRSLPGRRFLVPFREDRWNRVAGFSFADRVEILEGVSWGIMQARKEGDGVERVREYAEWAFLTMLREMMRRWEMTWAEAVQLIPASLVPPEFRDVDLRQEFMRMRRESQGRVVGYTRISSRELNRYVLASLLRGRGPENGLDEGAHMAFMRSRQSRSLPTGGRYNPRNLARVLDYYGLAEAEHREDGTHYRVRYARLYYVLRGMRDPGVWLRLPSLFWMRGRYEYVHPRQ